MKDTRFLRLVASLLLTGIAAMSGTAAISQSLPTVPVSKAVDDKGVDLISGTQMLHDPGVSIGSDDSGGLSFSRTWAGPSGYQTGGWNHNFDYYMAPGSFQANGMATPSMGRRAEPFLCTNSQSGCGPWVSLKQDGTSLATAPNGTDTLFTDRDGTVVTFSPIGLLSLATLLVKPDGERWTFTYNQFSNGTQYPFVYLQSVQTNFGYQLKLEYPTQQLAISKVTLLNDAVEYCAPSAANCAGLVNIWPSITYARPSGPLTANAPYVLTSAYTEVVTDTAGNSRSFSITPDALSERITSIVPGTAGTSPINYTLAYSENPSPPTPPRVTAISDESGSWSYNYGAPNFLEVIDPSIASSIPPAENAGSFTTTYATTTITSPISTVGVTNYLQYQIPTYFPVVVSSQDGLGRISKYQYDAAARPTAFIPPEGTLSGSTPTAGYMQNTYDARGNVTAVTKVAKTGSPPATIVYTAGFDATCTSPAKCNKPNWIKDAKGNETDYTYDPGHGGILTEMQPAPTAGAARPLKLTTWVQIYGWVKSSSGTLVQSAYPIWRKATETECQTAAGSNTTTCDSAAPQTVTTYQYGASGTRFALLVKGVAVASGGVTLRTCYGYDIYGHKISETKPNANLATCP